MVDCVAPGVAGKKHKAKKGREFLMAQVEQESEADWWVPCHSGSG